jgi:hypothetical protein
MTKKEIKLPGHKLEVTPPYSLTVRKKNVVHGMMEDVTMERMIDNGR